MDGKADVGTAEMAGEGDPVASPVDPLLACAGLLCPESANSELVNSGRAFCGLALILFDLVVDILEDYFSPGEPEVSREMALRPRVTHLTDPVRPLGGRRTGCQ